MNNEKKKHNITVHQCREVNMKNITSYPQIISTPTTGKSVFISINKPSVGKSKPQHITPTSRKLHNINPDTLKIKFKLNHHNL